MVGYEGLYEVSSLGRVSSVLRLVPGKWDTPMRVGGQILTGYENQDGYIVVKLSDGSKHKRLHLVHRLVLTAFVGPCPEDHEGCHSPDPDRSNNRLDNLRWDTDREWRKIQKDN